MESSPKSMMDKRLFHKKMYKNARGRTPPWKEVYRQRCMERLRDSRSQLVNRFRSAGEVYLDSVTKAKMVQDIMEVEWTAMNQTNGFLNSKKVPVSHEDCSGEENQAVMLALMEEIQQDLINEEERLLIEILNYDSASLASQVAAQQSEEVICPVCQIQVLKESSTGVSMESTPSFSHSTGAVSKVLSCSCGLALQGANLTLSTVKSSLENTVSHHGQTCVGKMSFTPTTDTQGTNVLSTCQKCDWMSFLL